MTHGRRLSCTHLVTNLAVLALAAPIPGRADTLSFLNRQVAAPYRLLEPENGFAQANIAQGYRALERVLDGDHSHLGDRATDGREVVAGDPWLEPKVQAFLDAVARKNYEHLEVRTGDEVIFSETELRTACGTRPVDPEQAHAGGEDWILAEAQAPEVLEAQSRPEAAPTGVRSWTSYLW